MSTRFRIHSSPTFRWLMLSLSLAAISHADQPVTFVDQLSAGERASLGIDRMTPEQLAALNAAAIRFARGSQGDAESTQSVEAGEKDLVSELAETRTELERTTQALAEAKASLEQAPKESKPSFLDRAKVLLMPGTEIEYATFESRLTAPFSGWQKGTLFRLENGQIWRVRSGEYWSPREGPGKAIKIVPGKLGSFFAEFEDVRSSPSVELIR